MDVVTDAAFNTVIEGYPASARKRLQQLRALIVASAGKSDGVKTLKETLKWGEPSFVSNIGSTVRIGWNENDPRQCRMYFICTTKLVDTFREIYGATLVYEDNRALVFPLTGKLPKQEIAHCCSLALRYHKLKHLPLLGA